MSKLILNPKQITTLPTLYEVLQLTGNEGFDIGDEKRDWGNCFDCPHYEDIKDNYGKLMVLFALNIRVVRFQKDWYTTTTTSDFIVENKKAFTRFMNESNRPEYQPQTYGNEIDNDDDLFYDLYMVTFENLINGYYSEQSYGKLYNYIVKYSEAKKW